MSWSAAGTPTSACRSTRSPARWRAGAGLSRRAVHGVRLRRARLLHGAAHRLRGMLTAMFPSESAILMTALSASPTEAFADQHVVELHLPQDAVDRIADRIWQVLEKGPDGSAVRLADGPYPGSVFFASTETYDLFNTCNTWTAAVLHDAGLPIDHARAVGRSGHAAGGSDRDVAGAAAALISRAERCHSGRRLSSLAARRPWCSDGGGGLLLLKLRHPASNNGRSNAIRRQHMAGFLATSRGFARTRYQLGGGSARGNQLLRTATGERADLSSAQRCHWALDPGGRRSVGCTPSPPSPASRERENMHQRCLDCASNCLGDRVRTVFTWRAGFSRLPRGPRNTSDGGPRNTSDGGGGMAQAMPGASIGTAT